MQPKTKTYTCTHQPNKKRIQKKGIIINTNALKNIKMSKLEEGSD